MTPASSAAPLDRSEPIRQARQRVMAEQLPTATGLVAPWIERSWRRCVAEGRRPEERLVFDTVSPTRAREAAEGNRKLAAAARPVLAQLAAALAQTRYFVILADARGVVIEAQGAIDRSDPRALLITRPGTDLSEACVGTTAISAALIEQQPVWLHRAEHFFADTSAYSCAGAPLRGPDGLCVGMLDLTGIDVGERPALRHLAAQSARAIENALVRAEASALLLRLTWPGIAPGGDSDGLLALDADGGIRAANPAARDMLTLPAGGAAVHASELFATPLGSLFDARSGPPLDVPLWSGLRLWVSTGSDAAGSTLPTALPLKELESTLIRRAVDEARGNVEQAARRLGISRATVYRKLGRR